MSWITDKLLGLRAVFFAGEQLPERGALEFAGDGVGVEDDAVNKRTKITVSGGSADTLGSATSSPLVLMSSGGALEIAHGVSETQICRVVPGVPAEAGEIGMMADGRLCGWDGVNALAGAFTFEHDLERIYSDRLEAPATTMAERVLGGALLLNATMIQTITDAYFIPEGTLTAHADDYAIISVYKRNHTTGGSQTLVAQGRTTPSGLRFTGSWTAFKAVHLPFDGLTQTIEEDMYLTWEITLAGAGVTVPTGRLFVARTRVAGYPT